MARTVPIRSVLQEKREKLIQQLRDYFIKVGSWIQQNWFRLLIIGLLTFILLRKDVRLQLDLQNGSYPTVAAGSVRTVAFTAETADEMEVSVSPVSAEKNKQLAYIHRFANIARQEMKRFGIPASITLAQGLLETNAGESALATRNNNHFGIKCFSRTCKKGHCSNFEDDTHKDFFRNYDSAWESYRAHSLFLKDGERYQSLFELDKNDYQNWARGLREAGYATDKQYAKKLIRLIEELGLQEYDV